MLHQEKTRLLLPLPALLIAGAVYFTVWAKLYLDLYLTTDFGWLLICLERFLSGGTYTEDFYETNPPLSFLIYYPAYILYKVAGVFPTHAIFSLFSSAAALIAFIIWKYLDSYGFSGSMKIGLFGAYLFSGTWIISTGFGHKDHLVFLLLLPYILMQIGIISRKPTSRTLMTTSSLLGASAICIKPHYILIPAFFYVYRFYSERSLAKLILTSDLWIFVSVGAAYLLSIYVFFPDYINTVFPEVLELYTIDLPMPVIDLLKFLSLSACAFIVMLFVYETEETKYLKASVYSLIGLSLLCAIAYFVQNKGFFYQSAPFLAFAAMSFILSLFGLIYQSCRLADIAILVPCLLLLIFTKTYMTGHPPGYVSSQDFREMPYHQKLKAYASNGVYMDLEMKSSALSIPFYLNIQNASRFGQIWPILGLKFKFEASLKEQEKDALRKRLNYYIDMIAADITKNSPAVISIPRYIEAGNPMPTKAYFNFFMKNQNFSKSMEKYQFAETYTFNKNLYIRGAKKNMEEEKQTVDLYVLIDDDKAEKKDE
ncbi:MAG: hypothetical protein KA099_03245 [Alphaproteobacteria bacterium]|nr:hypothetical protein [Alphaproteobacteria bacterium]MBP7759489.1 hypothetical protein [Alphaproteobacteria bacterium]MBP7762829.1 hypothetical protein [Alphaproteobacteria bacterium]MBP7904319.1 hypothetical protein [Alphaproteobacteria bacterium]